MKKIYFANLLEAMKFVADHGGVAGHQLGSRISDDYYPPQGAFGEASSFVRLVDGCIFGVEAYTNGPLSDVTPDEDFGVTLLGFIPE